MTWTEAIIKVLQQNKNNDEYTPMHYIDITDAIIENKFKHTLGKTPQNTVNAYLTIQRELFESLGAGIYGLTDKGRKYNPARNQKREKDEDKDPVVIQKIEENEKSKVIKVFGMFWSRNNISWTNRPKLLGRQSEGSEPVDFSKIRGIYLLYDGREVIYVGQAINQPILKRLRQHTTDRLSGRWDRFSWFGIDGIGAVKGSIIETPQILNIDIVNLANALEGVLIEGLEPRQNRKQGNQFGNEYLQVIKSGT